MQTELVSWRRCDTLARRLAANIRNSRFHPTLIIAIGRGGWMPARLLSDLLGIINLTSFKIEHYRGAHKDAVATVRYPLVADVTGERVLVVDDVSDSGDTFRVALAHIGEHGTPAALRTAVLHHKTTSPLVPDYYGVKVVKWRWLIYPWAITEDLTEFARAMDPRPEDPDTLRKKLQEDYGLSLDATKLVDVMANLRVDARER